MLSAYSVDDRPEVQAEIVRAWPFFSPERFACQVLRTAPLARGRVSVDDLAVLPHLHLLENLVSVEVEIFEEPVDSFEPFAEVPHLAELHINAVGRLDLVPLNTQRTLRTLGVAGPGRLTNLNTVAVWTQLVDLTLFNLQRWTDISFIRELPQLERLTLAALQDVEDFSPLRQLRQLRSLQLHDCSRLIDLNLIAHLGQQLEHLTLTGGQNDRLPADFADMFPKVARLFLLKLPEIRIQELSQMPIRSLWLQSCDSVDLREAGELSNLQSLRIDYAKNVLKLDALRELPQLNEIRLHGDGPPIDAAVIRDLKVTLTVDRDRIVHGIRPSDAITLRRAR
jgi:hypothetical protein